MIEPPLPLPGRRIAVVGTSGTGKSTLAASLSEILSICYVEMDSLYWEPNWTPATRDVLRARVEEALGGDAWVCDGNYSQVRDIIWGRADTVVWLDYSLPVALRRVVRRTLRRLVTRQVLWHGNRETLGTLFERDSIILWTLTTHGRRRREYEAAFSRPNDTHLSLIRLPTPATARAWLAHIDAERRAAHTDM
jgi:adenylate kinase family enzyme